MYFDISCQFACLRVIKWAGGVFSKSHHEHNAHKISRQLEVIETNCKHGTLYCVIPFVFTLVHRIIHLPITDVSVGSCLGYLFLHRRLQHWCQNCLLQIYMAQPAFSINHWEFKNAMLGIRSLQEWVILYLASKILIEGRAGGEKCAA